jgi:hypothetical protein
VQEDYVAGFKGLLEKMVTERSLQKPVYAVVDASRKPCTEGSAKTFRSQVCINFCPTFSTSNKYLYLLKAGDTECDKVPSGGRFLDVKERALMCGVVWGSIGDLHSDNQHVMSFGNMIPVDMAGIVLNAIMCKWKIFEQQALIGGVPRALKWSPHKVHSPDADKHSRPKRRRTSS